MAGAPLAGCGSDDPAPLTVEEFLRNDARGLVQVEGFLLIDRDQARLCAEVAESSPPQCGGASVELNKFDPTSTADVVTSEGDASWLEGAALLLEPDSTGQATFIAIVGP